MIAVENLEPVRCLQAGYADGEVSTFWDYLGRLSAVSLGPEGRPCQSGREYGLSKVEGRNLVNERIEPVEWKSN